MTAAGDGPAQGGFILLDVLISCAMLALAATAIIQICTDAVRQQDDVLDRSAALFAGESAIREFTAFRHATAAAIVPATDGHNRFTLRTGKSAVPAGGLSTFELLVEPIDNPSQGATLIFFAPQQAGPT